MLFVEFDFDALPVLRIHVFKTSDHALEKFTGTLRQGWRIGHSPSLATSVLGDRVQQVTIEAIFAASVRIGFQVERPDYVSFELVDHGVDDVPTLAMLICVRQD